MTLTFSYRKPMISDVRAPYLPLLVSDPLEQASIEVQGLVDTGYDGELLIPREMYDKLSLNAFEFSLDSISIAETASGEQLELLSASGAISIKGSDTHVIVTIDSHDKYKEVIIGRKFLESYIATLKGPAAKITVEFMDPNR